MRQTFKKCGIQIGMFVPIRQLLIALLFICPFTSSSAQENQRAAKPNVALILDGSGSMWGRIGGKTKFEISQQAIGRFLAAAQKRINLSVIVYGHRQRRRCDDVEVYIPLGLLNSSVYEAKINKLSPLGKTPIGRSLQSAAKELDHVNKKSTIILLSDGFENCGANPCRIAGALRKNGKGTTIHVIGFGLKEKEIRRLRCIPDNAGGKYLRARNTEQLNSALQELARTIQGRPSESASQVAEIPLPPQRPKKKRSPKTKPGLTLKAVLRDGGQAIREDLKWTIYSAKTTANGKRRKIKELSEPEPFLKLKPGSYHVAVEYGLAKSSQDITIAKNRAIAETISLDAGRVAISAVATSGSPTLDRIFFQIFRSSDGPQNFAAPIMQSSSPKTVFRAPVGKYKVVAQHGHAIVTQPFSIKPGDTSDLTIVMDVGVLALSAVADEGGDPLKQMFFYVHKLADDGQSKGREIARSAADRPQFSLPAGTYVVSAVHDLAKSSELVTILPGEVSNKILNMNVGTLNLSSTLSNSSRILTEGVSYRIYTGDKRPDGKRQEIARTSRPSPTLRLSAGTYQIESHFGKINSVVTQNVKVNPAKLTELSFKHDSGLITLVLNEQNNKSFESQTFWLLFDSKGRELWRSSRASPKFALLQGNYKIIAEKGNRRFEKTFTVRTGDEKTVEVLAQ